MKINPTSIKYIEWRDPQGLHEDAVGCLSELRFVKDELQFLRDLIKSYTMDVLLKDHFEKGRELAVEVSEYSKELTPLIKKIVAHSNQLQTLVDDIDIPDEEDEYKTIHYQLMFEAVAFTTKFKKLKRKIFGHIKLLIKARKTPKLLNS